MSSLTLLKTIPQINITNFKNSYNTYDMYDFVDKLWISKISIINKKIIRNSNCFLDFKNSSNKDFQENGIISNNNNPNLNNKFKPHFIHTRLLHNYISLINEKDNIIEIDEECIYLNNSFTSSNAGHDLFCIISLIEEFNENKSIKFIMFSEINLKGYNNYKIIKLFINEDRIIRIKQNQIYNFKKQIFSINSEEPNHKVLNYSKTIFKIREKIINYINDNYSTDKIEEFKNKKVIIIKNTSMKTVVRKEDQCNASLLFEYLKQKGWYIANPEEDDFYEMAFKLLNSSIIITGQRGISCANQIFYNLDAKIISFDIHNKDTFILTDKNTYYYDFLCNSFYYDKIIHSILAPSEIKFNHLNDIIKIEEILNRNINEFIKLDNIRLPKNENSEIDISLKIKYGSKINSFDDCLKLLNNNLKCKQIVYDKKNKLCFPMNEFSSLYLENLTYDNDYISAYRSSESIIKKNIKIYIYNLENLEKICSTFPKLPPEMNLFDYFIFVIKNNYIIVNNINEADIAFVPIDFLKLIYISPHHSYSIVPKNCPPCPSSHNLKEKSDVIKFYWDNYVNDKLHKNSKIPHFMLYSYILYEIDFSYIPKNIYILAYENNVSYFNKIDNTNDENIDDRVMIIPYIHNENIKLNQKIISEYFFKNKELNDILKFKKYNIGFFGEIFNPNRPVLSFYRGFIKYLNLNNLNYITDVITKFSEYAPEIKYLLVLRGDTQSRLCFYQCFAYGIVPIIFERETKLYSKLLTNNILDSCLILPDKNINDEDYSKLVENILNNELTDPQNYLNKVKNHKEIFDDLNYYNFNECRPIFNIIENINLLDIKNM